MRICVSQVLACVPGGSGCGAAEKRCWERWSVLAPRVCVDAGGDAGTSWAQRHLALSKLCQSSEDFTPQQEIWCYLALRNRKPKDDFSSLSLL